MTLKAIKPVAAMEDGLCEPERDRNTHKEAETQSETDTGEDTEVERWGGGGEGMPASPLQQRLSQDTLQTMPRPLWCYQWTA